MDSRPLLVQQSTAWLSQVRREFTHESSERSGRPRKGLENLSDVSMKTLAAISGLSTSRFIHVFSHSIDIRSRPYIIDRWLQRACSALTADAAVTSAWFALASPIRRIPQNDSPDAGNHRDRTPLAQAFTFTDRKILRIRRQEAMFRGVAINRSSRCHAQTTGYREET